MIISSYNDPDYIVQGCYSAGRVCESTGSDDETEACELARKMLKGSTFEGSYVVVMTRDCELVWDSRQFETLGT